MCATWLLRELPLVVFNGKSLMWWVQHLPQMLEEKHHLVHMLAVEIDGRMGIGLLFGVVSTRTRLSGGRSPSR